MTWIIAGAAIIVLFFLPIVIIQVRDMGARLTAAIWGFAVGGTAVIALAGFLISRGVTGSWG